MKKILSIALVALIIVATGALSFGAMGRSYNGRRVNVELSNADNGSTYRNSYMEQRRVEYEKTIDEEVSKGNLTQEQADEYKADFFAMADYCNRVLDNNGNTSLRKFGCH